MTAISPGGMLLATGILWYSGAKNEKEARKRALDLTPTAGAKGAVRDFLCIRSTTPVQFGISNVKDGHQVGMTSAAAALADALPGSWAGLFAVPEGWYFVRTTLGIIAPRGDRVFRPEQKDQAIAALLQAKDGVDAIYAPAEFQIKDAHERLIEEIVAPAGKYTLFAPNKLRALKAPTDLRKVKQVRPTKRHGRIALAGVALVAAVAFGIDTFFPGDKAPVAGPPIWETARAAAEVTQTCTDALLAHPVIAGYKLHDASCTPHGATFNYKGWGREYRYLNAELPAPAGCTQTKADNGDIAVTCPIAAGRAQGRQNVGRDEDAKRLIYRHLSGLGLNVTYAPRTDQIKPVKDGGDIVYVPYFVVDMDGKFVPDTLVPDLTAMPAMTIETITYTPPANWHLKGKLYYVR